MGDYNSIQAGKPDRFGVLYKINSDYYIEPRYVDNINPSTLRSNMHRSSKKDKSTKWVTIVNPYRSRRSHAKRLILFSSIPPKYRSDLEVKYKVVDELSTKVLKDVRKDHGDFKPG